MPKAIWAIRGPNPRIGSVSMKRSAGWMYTGQPKVSATFCADQMWSIWPWVTSTAAGVSRFSSRIRRNGPNARCPGSTTIASEP